MIIDQLRLIGAPGSRKVIAGELSRLARRAFDAPQLPAPKTEPPCALIYPFDPALAALAVRYHRTASRVLWGLFQSRAQRLEPLYDELVRALAGESRGWLWDGARFSVLASNLGPFAAGPRQVVGAVKNALIDGAAQSGVTLRLDPEAPDLHLDLRMHDDAVVLSLDLAGRPMNQRGYRTGGGAAPLRETLAAMLVMLTRHDPRRELLVDPLAGSGTIAIEAACMARGTTVWVPPRFPAARCLPPLADLLDRGAEPLFADTRPLIVANELDSRTHALCRENVGNAGVEDDVRCRAGDFRQIDPLELPRLAAAHGLDAQHGVILSNPPYGERLRPPELKQLYHDLGRWCRRLPGWRAAFIAVHPAFEASFGGRPRIRKPLRNGPLRATFLLYDL